MPHLSVTTMESGALKELSDEEMRRVEEHVACCAKCRDHLEGELVWVAQRRSPFRRKVEKMIEKERRKRKRAAKG